jgi:hypothetical protein
MVTEYSRPEQGLGGRGERLCLLNQDVMVIPSLFDWKLLVVTLTVAGPVAAPLGSTKLIESSLVSLLA